MRPRRPLLVALLALCVSMAQWLLVGSGSVGASAFQVVGFQDDGDAPSAIRTDAPALTQLDVGTVFLSAGGQVDPVASSTVSEQRLARSLGLPTLLVVSNWDDSVDDFSEPLAHQLLGDRQAIGRVAHALAVDVERQGWQGVNVDLENLTTRDAAGLVRLLAALRTELGAHRRLTVDVFGLTDLDSYLDNGYRLTDLARDADAIDVMGYDDHISPGDPGPVGPLDWQRAVLRVVLSEVPARQVVLGVAGYGYSWGPRPGDDQYLSDAQARATVAAAGVTPTFDTGAGEWTARLPGGVVLWWSDARSWALRVPLARSLGLAGVALWDLALADPLPALPH